jgi:hypothetical protein
VNARFEIGIFSGHLIHFLLGSQNGGGVVGIEGLLLLCLNGDACSLQSLIFRRFLLGFSFVWVPRVVLIEIGFDALWLRSFRGRISGECQLSFRERFDRGSDYGMPFADIRMVN